MVLATLRRIYSEIRARITQEYYPALRYIAFPAALDLAFTKRFLPRVHLVIETEYSCGIN